MHYTIIIVWMKFILNARYYYVIDSMLAYHDDTKRTIISTLKLTLCALKSCTRNTHSVQTIITVVSLPQEVRHC